MSGDAITYEAKEKIAVITLNRAACMNRLNADIIDGLESAWTRLMQSKTARVSVLTCDGPSFSVEADLKAVPHNLFHGIPSIGVPVDKPIVSAVRGWCVGGGMEYADRIASQAPLPSRMLNRFVSETIPKGSPEITGIARAQVNVVNATMDRVEGLAAFMQ